MPQGCKQFICNSYVYVYVQVYVYVYVFICVYYEASLSLCWDSFSEASHLDPNPKSGLFGRWTSVIVICVLHI